MQQSIDHVCKKYSVRVIGGRLLQKYLASHFYTFNRKKNSFILAAVVGSDATKTWILQGCRNFCSSKRGNIHSYKKEGYDCNILCDYLLAYFLLAWESPVRVSRFMKTRQDKCTKASTFSQPINVQMYSFSRFTHIIA